MISCSTGSISTIAEGWISTLRPGSHLPVSTTSQHQPAVVDKEDILDRADPVVAADDEIAHQGGQSETVADFP